MPPRRPDERSSRVAWTTATHCCSVSATDYFDACSRCRTLPPAWSQAPVGVTTSHQCYGSCTGCQSVSALYRGARTSVACWSGSRVPRNCRFPSDMRKLLVPRNHNILGDRSFSAAGPQLWNDLPLGLRRPGLTFDSFRRSLKTHLFGDQSA